MRRSLAPLLALLLLATLALPADALTAQRVWRGAVGTSGGNGSHSLTAYDDGTGLLKLALKGLRWKVTYRVEIRAGSCSSLGSVLLRPGSVTTSATGTVATTRKLSISGMNAVWPTSRSGNIAIRYYNSTSIRCGNLTFNKATRIRVPYYRIDLPVIKSPNAYPYCNVAMYLRELSQPTEPGVTYIFGHARTGMFLPLLKASQVNNGAAMIGKIIYVYASNSKIHTYKITQVRRHVSSIQNVFGVLSETLWIQTSEGPNSTYPKLVIVAKRTATGAATYAGSHPTPHPIRC
ncbi:MAG: sortase [Candidatus Limnocylindrales bacterium]